MSSSDYKSMKQEAIRAMAEVKRVMIAALPVADKAAFEIANIEEHDPSTIPGAITDQARVVRYQLEIISQKLDTLKATAKEPVKS